MFDVIIVANGTSSRMGFDKLSFYLGDRMVIEKTIDCFANIDQIDKIILVSDSFNIKKHKVLSVKGGKTRTESVKCGLKFATSKYVLIHDGARPFLSKNLIHQLIETTIKHGSAIPYLPLTDSLRLKKNGQVCCVDRDDYFTVQTPQGFECDLLKKAYNLSGNTLFADDSEVFAKFIKPSQFIKGEYSNKKITNADDVIGINTKIGCGFDVHRFCAGKKLILGGVIIPFDMGLKAHSDGDVVIHALMDSLLSACNERDIGVLFPDTNSAYKDIDSTVLLKDVKTILDNKNADINNISIVIMAQTPKLCSFIPLMVNRISAVLDINTAKISISTTTTENLGITAENRGIAAFATVSLI